MPTSTRPRQRLTALPGALYIYQGDELGLEEVQDLPEHQLEDPMHFRSGGADPGRDGCRVPLPWSGEARPFGFSAAGATRSEERRVGKECYALCRSRWSPYH